MVKISSPKINIHLRWAIMLVLVSGELSASQIKESIHIGSCGVMQPSVGTLYPYLSSLVEAGWIAEKWPTEKPSEAGRPRFIYSLTDAGLFAIQAHQQLHEDLANWDTLPEQGRAAS